MSGMDTGKPGQVATLQPNPVVDERVLQVLQHGTQTLDDLGALLPDVNWSQLFLAIDRLSRSGKISLWSPGLGDYLISAKAGTELKARDRQEQGVPDE